MLGITVFQFLTLLLPSLFIQFKRAIKDIKITKIKKVMSEGSGCKQNSLKNIPLSTANSFQFKIVDLYSSMDAVFLSLCCAPSEAMNFLARQTNQTTRSRSFLLSVLLVSDERFNIACGSRRTKASENGRMDER